MIATGSQIRAARAGLGWSQEVLANHAGIHAKAVAYWERMGEVSRRQAQGRAPGRMLAALSSAGVEVTAGHRPAVIFNAWGRGLPPLLVAQGSP